MFAGKFADYLGVGRIHVKHRFESMEQREPERVGVAEGVEERQHASMQSV